MSINLFINLYSCRPLRSVRAYSGICTCVQYELYARTLRTGRQIIATNCLFVLKKARGAQHLFRVMRLALMFTADYCRAYNTLS